MRLITHSVMKAFRALILILLSVLAVSAQASELEKLLEELHHRNLDTAESNCSFHSESDPEVSPPVLTLFYVNSERKGKRVTCGLSGSFVLACDAESLTCAT